MWNFIFDFGNINFMWGIQSLKKLQAEGIWYSLLREFKSDGEEEVLLI